MRWQLATRGEHILLSHFEREERKNIMPAVYVVTSAYPRQLHTYAQPFSFLLSSRQRKRDQTMSEHPQGQEKGVDKSS